jgi:hypothetical protein
MDSTPSTPFVLHHTNTMLHSEPHFDPLFQLLTLKPSNSVPVQLKLSQKVLQSIPPNLCASTTSKLTENKIPKTKRLSLLVDFGLVPEGPPISFAKQPSWERKKTRTITVSDFMGHKVARSICSRNELRGITIKMKKDAIINVEKAKTKLTLMKSPKKMDEDAKFRALEMQKTCSRALKKDNGAFSYRKIGEKHRVVKKLDRILQSCDTLMQDNKKILSDIAATSKHIVKTRPGIKGA